MGKKKEKIKYVDDGRTIADMSGVSRASVFVPQKLSDNAEKNSRREKDRKDSKRENFGNYRASLKEQLTTFWNAMKMMFLPMLAVIGCIVGVYLLLQLVYMLTKI